MCPHANRHPSIAQCSASHRIASHPSHPPHHIIFGLKRRPQARLGGHRLGPVGSDWTVTSSIPTSAPRQNGAGALVGRQSVSVSVSVGSAQFITWWYAVGSGLGLVWSKSNSRPSLPTPGRNPLTRDPWTKQPIASLSSSPLHPCRPACSPGFCSQQFVCPAQPVAFGTGLGGPGHAPSISPYH